MKQILKSCDEMDCMLGRKYHFWQKGEISRIKRALNKRIRQDGRRQCRES